MHMPRREARDGEEPCCQDAGDDFRALHHDRGPPSPSPDTSGQLFGKNVIPRLMRSRREITADRRLLTARSTAKPAGWKCVFCATLRLQKDVVDLSTAREFACAPAAFRWRCTRNKREGLSTVATFCNNGHDERSQTVLAPSFPSRREVGDQCSDPAAWCFGSGRRCPRSAHPRSSVASGRFRKNEFTVRLGPASSKRGAGRARGPVSGEGLFTEHVVVWSCRRERGALGWIPRVRGAAWLDLTGTWDRSVDPQEDVGPLGQCPQLCGELVNTGGASPS